MTGRRKYGRPIASDVFMMMLTNLVIAVGVLYLVFAAFDVHSIIAGEAAAQGLTFSEETWMLLAMLLPGASIAYGILWYWLILTGRSRGVTWGGAGFYGISIAFGNMLFAGLLLGILNGNIVLTILFALVMLLVMPSVLLAMIVFGLTMGALNGRMAAKWIERHRP